MHIVLAPDSFKGSLSAAQVCREIAQVVHRLYPQWQVHACPLADGGEGTVEALHTAIGGQMHSSRVTDPYGKAIDASWALLSEGTAVCEMASASGLALSPRRDPLTASSFGTGQLLLDVFAHTEGRVLLGLGGSATNDGGAGFLYALGARYYDGKGHPVTPVAGCLGCIDRVDLSGLAQYERRLAQLEVLCDVRNPLCGPDGATAVYGPQKGVTEATYGLLEDGLRSFSSVLRRALHRDVSSFPGAGAAGGMGMALGGVLGVRTCPGIDRVLSLTGFDSLLAEADLCITGEGRLDGQSVRYGKAVAGIARRCAQAQVPLGVIVGGMGEGARELYDICPCALCPLPSGPMPLSEAMENAQALMADAAERLLRTLSLGMDIHKRQTTSRRDAE